MTESGLLEPGTIPELGRLVGAEAILSGSYHLIDQTLQVKARLIDVETSAIIENIKTSGPIEDLDKIQESLINQLLDGLEIKLASLEKEWITSSYMKSLEAAIYYARATSLASGNPEGALKDQ